MPAIIIGPVGAVLPIVSQRGSDEIKYTVDCTSLLDTNELISCVSTCEISSSDVSLMNSRSRRGTSLEFTIITLNTPGPEFVEYSVKLSFTTTFNNTKSIAFKVRIYK